MLRRFFGSVWAFVRGSVRRPGSLPMTDEHEFEKERFRGMRGGN